MMKKRLYLCAFLVLMALSGSILAETVGDFDGDGKTDLVVYRRNNQNTLLYWYVLNSSNNLFSATQWGNLPGNQTTSDLPAFGDYDGDGRTDLAVFRRRYSNQPQPDYFFILRSSDSTMQVAQWGIDGDYQVPQDYDGDGKTDIAVARADGGLTTWYILQSRDGYREVSLPRVGYPVAGDYDGDGKADCAMIGSTSEPQAYWYVRKSSTGELEVTQFGNGYIDYFVPGDYDGDGRTDLAVWRGKNEVTSGFWIWRRSTDGNWGYVKLGTGFTAGDHPVQGDYDGDGKTDPAIFRTNSSSGAFHILSSQRGYYAVPWGWNSDEAPLFYQNR